MKEYLIYEDTLKDIANKFRERLKNNYYSLKSDYVNEFGAIRLLTKEINIYYWEYFNFSADYADNVMLTAAEAAEEHTAEKIIAYTYLPNEHGQIIPVLYKTNTLESVNPDIQEPFYYIGKATDEQDKLYDKWEKKIVNAENGEEGSIYIYTDIIVNVNRLQNGINPSDFTTLISSIPEFGHYNTVKITFNNSSGYLTIITDPALLQLPF